MALNGPQRKDKVSKISFKLLFMPRFHFNPCPHIYNIMFTLYYVHIYKHVILCNYVHIMYIIHIIKCQINILLFYYKLSSFWGYTPANLCTPTFPCNFFYFFIFGNNNWRQNQQPVETLYSDIQI